MLFTFLYFEIKKIALIYLIVLMAIDTFIPWAFMSSGSTSKTIPLDGSCMLYLKGAETAVDDKPATLVTLNVM